MLGAERVLANLHVRVGVSPRKVGPAEVLSQAKVRLQAGGPGSGCHGPNCGRPRTGGADIPRSELPLTTKEKAVEGRFRRQIEADPKKAMLEYRAKFGNVLNADNAKELSPDYQKDRTLAAAVHEPASWLVKQLYNEELATVRPDKLNTVFFTAGGAGSGKTTAIEGDPQTKATLSKVQVIYDGTLRPAAAAAKKIDQALQAGKEVVIMYVHRDPVDAFVNGVLPRAERIGRTVPMREFANQYLSIQQSMQDLQEKYKDNKMFTLGVIDNSYGKGNAKVSSLDKLSPVTHASVEHMVSDLKGYLKESYDKGRISEKVYRATLGVGHGRTKEVGI